MCMDPVIGEQLLLQGGLSSILREANLSNESNSKDTEENIQAQVSSCALQALLNLSAQTRTQELLMETQEFMKTIFKLAEGDEGEEGTEKKKKNPEVSSLQVQWQAVKILTNLSIENSTRETLLDIGLGDLITRLLGETLVISGRKGGEEEAGKEEEERSRIYGLMRYRLLQMLCNLIGSTRWLQAIRDSKPLQEHFRTLLNQQPTDEEKSAASLLISRSASTTAT
jgi:hypothetical protein